MTRFDADDPGARRKLFAEAITAHRTRASRFVTLEADTDTDPVTDLDGEEGGDDASRPWVQFGDNTFNLIGEFQEFRIEQLESPDEAEGTNARVTARSDPNRLAAFADRVFLDVYGRPEAYRAWVAGV